MIIQRQPFLLPLNPVDVLWCYTVFFHGNAIIYRANELAKIAAYTFFIYNGIGVIWISLFNFNGLMRCILAGNIAKTAVNTFVLVYFGNMMIVDVEVFPMSDGINRFADKIIKGVESFFFFFFVEDIAYIVNSEEAVLDSGGA